MTNTYKILVHGFDYEIVIIDGTHLKYRVTFKEFPLDNTPFCVAQHFNQLSYEMIDALKEKGLVRDNRYLKVGV
jgi:hypothetical protein